MAKTAKITNEMAAKAQQIAKQANSARHLRIALSVIIPKTCGASNAVTASILGVSTASVVRMQRQIREQVTGQSTEKNTWGGRRRQLLSIEQEARFLEPWIKKAQASGDIDVPLIHAALEKQLGWTVAISTVYRMLARHGWRKTIPQTRRPKKTDLPE